jgi:hypothetical protein
MLDVSLSTPGAVNLATDPDSYPVRAFLAAPSVRLTGPADGVLPLRMRERIAALRVALLDSGVMVYSAHQDQEWVSRDQPPGPRLPSPFRAMQSADIVFAYIGSPLSAAVGIELGWATALRKPIVLIVDRVQEYNRLIEEMESVTAVLPLADNPDWSPSAWRRTVVTALDWSDCVEALVS